MEGWIKLHRRMTKWHWYHDSNMVHLFLHLLLMANSEDGQVRGIPVKRGQYLTGRKALSDETGLSEQEVRTCLWKLSSKYNPSNATNSATNNTTNNATNEITTKATKQFTIITICKYEEYQGRKNSEQPTETAQEQPTVQPAVQPAVQPQTRRKKKEERSNKPFDPISFCPEFIPGDLWGVFLENRKFKKLQSSELALTTVCNQLKAAVQKGHTIEECVGAFVEGRWTRFRPEWMDNLKRGSQQGGVTPPPGPEKCETCQYNTPRRKCPNLEKPDFDRSKCTSYVRGA
jgi:hypothetical protein